MNRPGTFTHIDQAEVVLIDRKLLRSNLFLQSRGIGALWIEIVGLSDICLTNKSLSRSFLADMSKK